jgi:VWFA-related protein
MAIPAKWVSLLSISFLGAGIAGISPLRPALNPQNQDVPEIKSEETTPAFTVRAQRNEVLVRVVVRDNDGKAVGGLTKDDFRLSDDGKPQSLTVFRVETFATAPAAALASPSATAKPATPSEAAPALALPQRYVAFYFDDLVVTFEDLVRTRAAAEKYIASSMQPEDRAGVFTSSTLGDLDFTDDRVKLREALANLQPRPRTVRAENDCPPLTPYESYLIDERHDSIMLNIATWEVIACACGGDPKHCGDPQSQAQQAARITWQNDQVQSRQCLHILENLVRRLGALPGQHSILWLSQGFLATTLQPDLDQLIDRALREHVVISALDARGLWVDIPGGDASEHNVLPLHASGGTSGLAGTDHSMSGLGGTDPSMSAKLAMYRRTGKEMGDDVMAYVSHDTGGVFVHNTNDYDGGFRQAGALPEVSYLLAFSPQNLKYDGKFHKLKVELVNSKGLSVQARNGYFAPSQDLRPEERAKQEIDDAVFAREEYLGFPVDVHTQFFKLSDNKVQLSVTARIDAHALRFHKEGDRSRLNLKMVCVAFDRDGNLVDGTQRDVALHLQDATLAHVLTAGLNLRGQLKVSAGTYALRVVVYEIDSARMTALNRTVEIPY